MVESLFVKTRTSSVMSDGHSLVYNIILPIICSFGLIGNALSFMILTRKRFRTDNIMYAYMAGLAVIDTAYLICTATRCYYNLIQDIAVKCEEDPHTVWMDVNILPGLSTIFGTSSDLVIAFMTVNRYHLIKGLDEHRVVHLKKWIGYFEVLTALLFCSMCSLPYFFQHEIVKDLKNVSDSNSTDLLVLKDCYSYRPSHTAGGPVWTFFTVVLQTLLRIIPTFGISVLNIHMFRKLKKILRERRLVREKRRVRRPSATPVTISYGHLVEDVVVATNKNGGVSEALNWRRVSSGSEFPFVKRHLLKRPQSKCQQSKCRMDQKIRRVRNRPRSMMLKVFHKGHTKSRDSRELRSTSILLCVVISHFVLSTPGNVLFFVCAVTELNKDDGNGSIFPSFNGSIMNEHPWLAGFTYFAHTLFALKYAINYILYFATNKIVREETVKLLFHCKNLYWYKFGGPNFATM